MTIDEIVFSIVAAISVAIVFVLRHVFYAHSYEQRGTFIDENLFDKER